MYTLYEHYKHILNSSEKNRKNKTYIPEITE